MGRQLRAPVAGAKRKTEDDYGRFSWNLEPSDDPDNNYGEERILPLIDASGEDRGNRDFSRSQSLDTGEGWNVLAVWARPSPA